MSFFFVSVIAVAFGLAGRGDDVAGAAAALSTF